MSQENPMIPIQFRLTIEQIRAIKALSVKTGIKQNALVRQAIDALLAKNE